MSESEIKQPEQQEGAPAEGAPQPPAPETAVDDTEGVTAGEATAEPASEDDAQPAPGAGAGEADKYLALAQRTQADFANYRKRMARENAAAVDRGVSKLAKELLPALDHLDHALKAAQGHTQAAESAGPGEDLVKGFVLVRDEIVNALARAGIQPFSPQGEVFDPNEHEAMVQQPSEDAESGTVIDVYQQGYRINGQVLRPARVVVAA